jgi:hypothetical protein
VRSFATRTVVSIPVQHACWTSHAGEPLDQAGERGGEQVRFDASA